MEHHLTVNVNGGLDTEASQSDLNLGRWKMDSLSDSKAFFGIAGQKRDMNLYTLKWSGNKPTKAHSSYKTVPLVISDILPRSEPTRKPRYTKSLALLSNIQQVYKNFTPFPNFPMTSQKKVSSFPTRIRWGSCGEPSFTFASGYRSCGGFRCSTWDLGTFSKVKWCIWGWWLATATVFFWCIFLGSFWWGYKKTWELSDFPRNWWEVIPK